MIIKPGTHTLRVRYWVKDIVTNVEGTITKILSSFTYAKNTYYDMMANLNVKDYAGNNYYMWDAQQQYWAGHEWDNGGSQPFQQSWASGGITSNDYPKNNSDPRYYNESYLGLWISNPATHSCTIAPNVNEMCWYAAKGDPRWDDDELWTTMGHLYKGGMWIKKKANIIGYNTNFAPDGSDWRRISRNRIWGITGTLPPVADANNYFYLPALGGYTNGTFDVGTNGVYWSSSAEPSNDYGLRAYYLGVAGTGINVSTFYRERGFKVMAFE